MESTPKPKRLAVLETEAHAEEVVAQAGGKDMLDGHYPVFGKAPPPVAPDLQLNGRGWEANRPMEVELPPPPVVPFSNQWQRRHGRFCKLPGFGKHALLLLRARRAF